MSDRINYGSIPAEWPYPVKYGTENKIETDVLIIGAGVAGSMAGLMAARRGVKTAIVDKAPVNISGCGGAGLDHYLFCYSNPDSTITPEEFMELPPAFGRGEDHRSYIQMKGSWDNLLELEKLGLKFRDEEGEFEGAPFRDDKTKVMYAYDYKTKDSIRLRGGAYLKQHMRDGLAKEKTATLFERIMITSLLTEDGKQGARVVGATGLHEETGGILYIQRQMRRYKHRRRFNAGNQHMDLQSGNVRKRVSQRSELYRRRRCDGLEGRSKC